MEELKAVILAAGAGSRMVSNTPKVLHKILDKSLIEYVIESAKESGVKKICVVVGHKSEEVKSQISEKVEFVEQKEQLGTAHAVIQAKDFIGDKGLVFILFGDAPLICGSTLKKAAKYHRDNNNAVTVLTTKVNDPSGYGRIIRDKNNKFIKSVEDKDADERELLVNEINSGLYCFEAGILNEALKTIKPHNSQGEYYLPDTIEYIINKGLKADALLFQNYEEFIGINSRVQLFEATKIMQKNINENLMENGVTIINPEQTYIGKDVKIGKDTIIYPNCFIEGKTNIGENCIIGLNTSIKNSIIKDNSTIKESTIIESEIGKWADIGPYSYIRPNCKLGNHIKVGDFVEIKNSTIDDNTKIPHLTYVGDADVGKNVNFGCGSVVVNFNGVEKTRTTIKDHAFIGCNTNLVSPVVIEEKAYTAAGSTITKNVPSYSLGIARAQQVNLEDWVKKNRNN